ncbi:MAG TPA: type II secretion system protein [Nitratidesulfovibrio sp.]|nr:type II secretion system protein [Nitratidesulfovibrio sp.]
MTTHTTQHSSRPSQHGEPGPAPCRTADGRRAGDTATTYPPAPHPARDKIGQHGFTAVELIAVLVIIGIIAAVAMERFFDQSAGELGAIESEVRSHLAYARTRSMNADEVFGVQIRAGGTTYSIFRAGNTGTLVTLPGETNGVITLPQGATFTSAATIISFDRWGRPGSDAGAATRRIEDTTVTISYQGRTQNIVVTRNTGFLR